MKVKNFMKKFSALVLGLGLTLGVVSAVDSNSAHEVDAVDKVKSVSGIVSGSKYYIGATKSNGTDYYLSIADHGSTVTTGKKGSAVTNKADADIFTLSGSESSWSIKFESGNFMTLSSSDANGKVDIVANSVNWSVSNSSGLLEFKINNHYLKCNSQTNTANFGSYKSGQLNVWLELVSSGGCDHSWGTGVVTTAATCTSVGETTYTCSKCQETKTEEIPMLSHNYSYTSNGVSGHSKICSVGGESVTESHTFGDVENGRHTCELCGYNEKFTAPVYEKVTSLSDLPANFIIVDESNSRAFNGNDETDGYSEITITDDKITNTTNASVVEINTIDGGYSVKIVSGGDHVGSYIGGKSNTNTIVYSADAILNEITFADGYATMLSNSTSLRFNATSGQDRFRYIKTSTTGDSYHLPALFRLLPPPCEHPNGLTSVASTATCTTDGNGAYWKCLDCGKMFSDQMGENEITSIPSQSKLNHDFSVKQNTVAPTCLEQGYTVYKCSRCSATENRDYTDALGHDYVQVGTSTATCTVPGSAHFECSRCDDSYDVDGEALGHDYEIVSDTSTCTEAGIVTEKCSRCEDEITHAGEALGHDFSVQQNTVAPTCTEDGYTVYKCSRCDETTHKDAVSATGHSYSVQKEVVAPTCTEQGYTVYGCAHTGCLETENRDYVDPKGHNYVLDTEDPEYVAATAEACGKDVFVCSECGDRKTEVTDPIDFATLYTSNVTFDNYGGTSASDAKVVIGDTEYDAIKAGTGKVQGSIVLTIPSNVQTLHFHALGWKGETVTISVNGSSFDLTSNDGISSSSPFTISGELTDDCYFEYSPEGKTTVTFTATAGNRFVLFGVNMVQQAAAGPVEYSIDADGLVHMSTTTELTKIEEGSPLNMSLVAEQGYALPEDLLVKMAGVTLVKDTDYTFTGGTLSIASVTGDLIISGRAITTDVKRTTYTSNINLQNLVSENSSATTVNIHGEQYTAIKAGKSSGENAEGEFTIELPENAKSVSFFAAAWNGETGKVDVNGTEFTLLKDSGVSGNGNFSLVNEPSEFDYFELNLNKDAALTFKAVGGLKRFVVFGVNVELYTIGELINDQDNTLELTNASCSFENIQVNAEGKAMVTADTTEQKVLFDIVPEQGKSLTKLTIGLESDYSVWYKVNGGEFVEYEAPVKVKRSVMTGPKTITLPGDVTEVQVRSEEADPTVAVELTALSVETDFYMEKGAQVYMTYDWTETNGDVTISNLKLGMTFTFEYEADRLSGYMNENYIVEFRYLAGNLTVNELKESGKSVVAQSFLNNDSTSFGFKFGDYTTKMDALYSVALIVKDAQTGEIVDGSGVIQTTLREVFADYLLEDLAGNIAYESNARDAASYYFNVL